MSLVDENKENEQNLTNQEINKENQKNNNINEVIKAFKYFDRKGDGKIKISELIIPLTHFGNKMTEEEINKIFRKANIDINNNNDFDFMQLINFFNKK